MNMNKIAIRQFTLFSVAFLYKLPNFYKQKILLYKIRIEYVENRRFPLYCYTFLSIMWHL